MVCDRNRLDSGQIPAQQTPNEPLVFDSLRLDSTTPKQGDLGESSRGAYTRGGSGTQEGTLNVVQKAHA